MSCNSSTAPSNCQTCFWLIGNDEIQVLMCDGDDKEHDICRATRGFPTYYEIDAQG